MHCATCKLPISVTHQPLGLYTHNTEPAEQHRATPAPTEGQRVTRGCLKLIGFGAAAFLTGRALRDRA